MRLSIRSAGFLTLNLEGLAVVLAQNSIAHLQRT